MIHPDPEFVIQPFTTHHKGEHCVGLWHGEPWLFWRHPDGQWVSESKVSARALASAPAGLRELREACEPFVAALVAMERGWRLAGANRSLPADMALSHPYGRLTVGDARALEAALIASEPLASPPVEARGVEPIGWVVEWAPGKYVEDDADWDGNIVLYRTLEKAEKSAEWQRSLPIPWDGVRIVPVAPTPAAADTPAGEVTDG